MVDTAQDRIDAARRELARRELARRELARRQAARQAQPAPQAPAQATAPAGQLSRPLASSISGVNQQPQAAEFNPRMHPEGTTSEMAANVPDGMFFNPTTGQYTSREMIRGNLDRGRFDAVVSGGMQGAALGAGDEIVGTLAGVGQGPAMRNFRTEQARAMIGEDRQEYPATSIASEIAGGIMLPAGALTKGAGWLRNMARAAGTGAVMGAAYGFNEGEGSASERAGNVAVPALLGAAGGAAALPVGKAIGWAGQRFGSAGRRIFANRQYFDGGQITDAGRAALRNAGFDPADVSAAFQREFADQIGRIGEPEAAARAAGMAEFNIPAYRHNVTGSPEDFAAFERARRGGAGEAASNRIRPLADDQFAATQRAAETIATDLSGGRPADQLDAAVAITDRLRRVAQEQRSAAQLAYDAADAADLRIDPDAAQGVFNRIQTRLAAEEIDTTLSVFDNARAFISRLAQRGQGDQPVSLRLIDGLRKDLNATISRASGEDARALNLIKSEYDTWVDDVISARMFSGDEAGLDLLKNARSLWSEYAQTFRGDTGASKFIQQMVDADAAPDDVVRWLFSAGRLGTGKLNSNLAQGLRDVLGETSDEWNMFRQAAFRQLVQKPEGTTPMGPQAMAENINRFLSAPGTRSLAETMFDGTERSLMRRYAGALRQMVPPPGAVNYSGTAYEGSRMIQQAAQGLAGALGFGVSGGNPVVGLAAAQGAGALQRGANALEVRAMGRAPNSVAPIVGLTAPAAIATNQLSLGQQE